MTVNKGKGKHSSSQSPAMNFDRSVISLRLNMGYVDVQPQQIKHVTSAVGQRHNLNKLGRCSQDDATNIISRL